MPRQAYKMVYQALREQILSEALVAGQRLATERELAEMHDVSRITVRQALRLLEQQGLIERFAGRGTFVRASKPGKLAIVEGDFAGSVQKDAPDMHRELVRFETAFPPADVAKTLELESGQACLITERLDIRDEGPVAFDVAYLHPIFCDSVSEAMARRVDFLSCWLRAEELEYNHSRQSIEAIEADTAIAERLGIANGKPVLVTREVLMVTPSKPTAVFDSFYRADRVKLVSARRE